MIYKSPRFPILTGLIGLAGFWLVSQLVRFLSGQRSCSSTISAGARSSMLLLQLWSGGLVIQRYVLILTDLL